MGCGNIPVMMYFSSKEYSGRGQRQCSSAGDLTEESVGGSWYQDEAFRMCSLYGTAWCPGTADGDGKRDQVGF